MIKEDAKLLKLSLQFFGDDESGDDDFDDSFFDDDEDLDESDEEEGGETGDQDSPEDTGEESENDSGEDLDDEEEDGSDHDSDSNDPEKNAEDESSSDTNPEGEGNGKSADTNVDLIAELRALGYVGNDLASLTADMKQKREAKAEQDAKVQKAADKADGKAHIRAGAPGKHASGDGTGGITESQVQRFVENTGSTKESARERLARHARLIAGN